MRLPDYPLRSVLTGEEYLYAAMPGINNNYKITPLTIAQFVAGYSGGAAAAAQASYLATLALASKVVNLGTPVTFTSRALTAADNGVNLICATAQVATVNTGLGVGFGCVFRGTITFAGTATVNDQRISGAAVPYCALVQSGTDTYDVVGSKI